MPLSLEARAAILQAGYPVFDRPPFHWVDRDAGRSTHEIISDVLARDAAHAMKLKRLQRRAGYRLVRVGGTPAY
jgi:lysozyme family protein